MNAIEINNVEFSYPTEPKKSILKIAHWSVKQGDQLFIHGPSGSGKSTLLNLLCGIHQANSGNICILGELLNHMNSRQRDKYRANYIGYIFQQFNLIEYLNAIDNVKLASQFSIRTCSSNLLDDIHNILSTLDLDPLDWHRPVNQLSTGQQQRVGIARALINKPKLIIADEPTSSLDQASINNFMSLLTMICQKQSTTLLFVSHDMSLKNYFHSSIALADINTFEAKH